MGIDILIPVLGRPANAQPVVDSIVASTHGSYRIIFICSPGDDAQYAACQKTGQETWLIGWGSDRADYAKKINWGFTQTSGEWIFTGADDLRFRTMWDVHALQIGKKKAVVGTNDLHNPGCRRGVHSTHLLIRRSYLEQHSGTFDGSGQVFSEEYDHQYVDNELILVARRRGEWGFSSRAVVEHFHPHWGNAAWDKTYKKAVRDSVRDRRLFQRRMQKMERVG